jgi:transcriptional regulator with XRE-family HTH domain
MAEHRRLEQAMGGELKRLREAQGVRQDTIAYVAQKFGLSWTQSTVAAIEGGRRSLSIGELGLLPTIATMAGIFVQRVLDLMPDTDESVIVAPGIEIPLNRFRSLYGSREERESAPSFALPEKRHIATEAERKAGRALGASPVAVLRAAVDRWGHSLADERDRRIGARAETLSPRSLQAVRGRITRKLVRELRPRIKRRKPNG